jgi:hypothetical protein
MSKLPVRTIYSSISHLSTTSARHAHATSTSIHGVSSVQGVRTLQGSSDKSSASPQSNSKATREATERIAGLNKRSLDPVVKQEGHMVSGGGAGKVTFMEKLKVPQKQAAPDESAQLDTQGWNGPTVWAHLW